MRKKLYNIVLFITMIFGCLSWGSCGKWYGGDLTKIRTLRTVGTFSGYRVDCIQYIDTVALLWTVEYYVDDVYISTFPDTSYGYAVYTNKKDHVSLKKAYEQGLITHDDLLAIAEAEKPIDDLNKDQE